MQTLEKEADTSTLHQRRFMHITEKQIIYDQVMNDKADINIEVIGYGLNLMHPCG